MFHLSFPFLSKATPFHWPAIFWEVSRSPFNYGHIGDGGTWASFWKWLSFLMLTKKKKKKKGGQIMPWDMVSLVPEDDLETWASLWGGGKIGALLSVLLMRCWLPFQRWIIVFLMSISLHKNPIRRDCLKRGVWLNLQIYGKPTLEDLGNEFHCWAFLR